MTMFCNVFAGPVFIAWLGDTSAYVSLHHRDQASLVQRTLSQSDMYTVMTYAAHQQLQDGITNCKCAHSGGKSLCSSCIRKRAVAKHQVPFSPTASVRKRRLIESLQEEPPEVQTSAPKRFGE
jgi:hypothetical protein